MPSVSVIMPVYNASPYLRESIESILNQSFKDFEFLIFNDGSTDDSAEIIKSYQDERITFQDYDYNQGLAKLLNIGISRSRGNFIARMDADDIACPQRFEKQVNFLTNHHDYVVCGTNYSVVGQNEISNLPIEDDEIKLQMLFITPFCHPSVMIRAKTLKDNQIAYVPEHVPTEDHELWVTLSDFGKFHNLPESLLQYRVHSTNVSLRGRTPAQKQKFEEFQINYIAKFFKNTKINKVEIELLHRLFFKESGYQLNDLVELGELIQKIKSIDSTYAVPSEKAHAFLEQKFYYRCTTSTNLGLKVFQVANKYIDAPLPIINNSKLFIKALIKYNAKAGKG